MVAPVNHTISYYIYSTPSGWDKLPHDMILGKHGMSESQSVCFLNATNGMQLMASLRDFESDRGTIETIHITITPMTSLRPDLTLAQLLKNIEARGTQIVEAFFNTKCQRLPDDPKHPRGRHWLIPLRGKHGRSKG